MRQLELPVVDLQAYDRVEVYQSVKTGAWVLYRFRHIAGRPDVSSLLVATYGSRTEAMRIRNRLRIYEERLRTSFQYDERQRVWSGLDVAAAQET